MKTIALSILTIAILIFCCRAEENCYNQLTALEIDDIPSLPAARPQIAIAFGGGGVRGFIHLGVIKALEEAGIKADIVAGSSAGSIIASLYAAGLHYKELKKTADQLGNWQVIRDMVLSRKGFFQGKTIAKWVNNTINMHNIEQQPIPLGGTVTDLNQRKSLLVVAGNVGQAVQTSCSIPGSFIPVHHNDSIWVDGGMLSVVPVDFARKMGAEIVIGVDIYCANMPQIPKANSLSNVIFNQRMLICKNSAAEMQRADILIRPIFEPKNEIDLAQKEDAIAAGYQAAKKILPQLKERIATAHANAALTTPQQTL